MRTSLFIGLILAVLIGMTFARFVDQTRHEAEMKQLFLSDDDNMGLPRRVVEEQEDNEEEYLLTQLRRLLMNSEESKLCISGAGMFPLNSVWVPACTNKASTFIFFIVTFRLPWGRAVWDPLFHEIWDNQRTTSRS